MRNPLISIIIPCYNVAEYLPKCIDSLSNQTLNDIEFVFVNDGSTDNSFEILTAFEKSDERVVLITKENEGVSKARNDALKKAKGEYIFFLDGDDFLDNDTCEKMYRIISGQKADILVFNYYYIKKTEKKEFRSNIPVGTYEINDFLNYLSVLPISPKLYRRDILRSNNVFFEEQVRFGEILIFFVSALKHSEKITVTDEFFYNYYMRDDSAIHSVKNIENDITIIDTVKMLEKHASEFRSSILEASFFKNSVFKIIYTFTFFKYIKSGQFSKEIESLLKSIITNETVRKYFTYKASIKKTSSEKIFAMITLKSVKLSYYLFSLYFKIIRILK